MKKPLTTILVFLGLTILPLVLGIRFIVVNEIAIGIILILIPIVSFGVGIPLAIVENRKKSNTIEIKSQLDEKPKSTQIKVKTQKNDDELDDLEFDELMDIIDED